MTRDEARKIFNNLTVGCTVLFNDWISGPKEKTVTSIEKCFQYGTCSGTYNESIRVCNGNQIGFDDHEPQCISICSQERKCNIEKIIKKEEFITEEEFKV